MKPRTPPFSSRDRLPVGPRLKISRQRGVIRLSRSILDSIEHAYAVVTVIVFSGAFVQMVFGEERPLLYYVIMATLYSVAGCFLFLALFYRRLPVRVSLSLVLLLVLAIASSWWSVDPSGTLFRSVSLAGTSLVGVYFAVRFQPRELLSILWRGYAIMAIASLLVAVLAPQIGVHQGNAWGTAEAGMWRGVFSHKNTLGNVMLLALITCVVTYFERATVGRIYRLANLAMLFLAAVLLIFSASTTAQVLALMSAVVLMYVAFARRAGLLRGPLTLLAAWLMAIVGLVVLSDLGTFTDLVGKDVTLTGRTVIWHLAIQLIEERPVWGYGYANEVIKNLLDVLHAHNGYIQLAVDLGLVGCGLFLLLLLQTGWKCYEHAMASPGAMAAWPLVVFSVLVVKNVAEASNMGSNSVSWLLFVYLSASGALMRSRWSPGSRASTGSMAAPAAHRRRDPPEGGDRGVV